jgi:hypothetical protein
MLGRKAVPIINKGMRVLGDKIRPMHQTLFANHCYCLLMAVCFLTRGASSMSIAVCFSL